MNLVNNLVNDLIKRKFNDAKSVLINEEFNFSGLQNEEECYFSRMDDDESFYSVECEDQYFEQDGLMEVW